MTADWRECFGGPLDGDRVDADYPDPLEVIVTAPADKYILDLRVPDSPVPTVCCCTTRTHRPLMRQPKRPVHVYFLCADGHYHHQDIRK